MHASTRKRALELFRKCPRHLPCQVPSIESNGSRTSVVFRMSLEGCSSTLHKKPSGATYLLSFVKLIAKNEKLKKKLMTTTADRLPTSARLHRRRNHSRRRRNAKLSVRLVLLGALVLLAFAGNTAAASAGGLVVVESADDAVHETTTAAPTVPNEAMKERIPEFVATEEWKEILPGQGIPRVRCVACVCCMHALLCNRQQLTTLICVCRVCMCD